MCSNMTMICMTVRFFNKENMGYEFGKKNIEKERKNLEKLRNEFDRIHVGINAKSETMLKTYVISLCIYV